MFRAKATDKDQKRKFDEAFVQDLRTDLSARDAIKEGVLGPEVVKQLKVINDALQEKKSSKCAQHSDASIKQLKKRLATVQAYKEWITTVGLPELKRNERTNRTNIKDAEAMLKDLEAKINTLAMTIRALEASKESKPIVDTMEGMKVELKKYFTEDGYAK